MADDLVIKSGKLNAKEIMGEGWIYFGIGAENYVAKIGDPRCPKWKHRASVKDWINERIRQGQVIDMEWPVKVYRQPQGIALFAIVDSPRDFDQTFYESKVFGFNFGQITNWSFVDLWKVPEFKAFFLKYFEDVGGRVSAPGVGPMTAGSSAQSPFPGGPR